MMKKLSAFWQRNSLLIEGYGILALMFVSSIGMFAFPIWAAIRYDMPLWSVAQDKSLHSVSISLYGRPEREGSRNYISAVFDDKPGYVIQFVRTSSGVSERDRHDLLQSPKMVTKESSGETVRNWPVYGNLIIASRIKTEWAEDRRNDNGIKSPKAFSKIEITLESKLPSRYESVIIYATNYDQPEKLIKKDWIVMDYTSALALYEFVEAGTPASINIDNPDTRQ